MYVQYIIRISIHVYAYLMLFHVYHISDEGSDSSESDGPPVQLMDKMGKKVNLNCIIIQ